MKGTNRYGKTASAATTRADRFDVIISGEINVIPSAAAASSLSSFLTVVNIPF